MVSANRFMSSSMSLPRDTICGSRSRTSTMFLRQMSKNNFKNNVHDTLLRILSEENDYIDLPDLITKTS